MLKRGEISLNRKEDVDKHLIVIIPFAPLTCSIGHNLKGVVVDFDNKYITAQKCTSCNKIYVSYSDYKVWKHVSTFRNARISEKSIIDSESYLKKYPSINFNRQYFDSCTIRISDCRFKRNRYGHTGKIGINFTVFLKNNKRPQVKLYYDIKEPVVYMNEKEFEKIAEEFISNVHMNDRIIAEEILAQKIENHYNAEVKAKKDKLIADYWGRIRQEPVGNYKNISPKDKRYQRKRTFFS